MLQIRREKQRAKEQAEARAAERAARALEDKREQRVRQQRRKSEQDKWIEGVKEKKKHAPWLRRWPAPPRMRLPHR